jgi:hypothetical protein
MPVSHKNGIAITAISALNGIAKAALAAIGGIALPAGGGASVEFVTARADYFIEAGGNATTATTSPAPSGSNLFALGGVAAIDSGIPVMSGVSYDDDGTPVAMTRLGADVSFAFENGAVAAFGVPGLPAEAMEFRGTWDAQRLMSYVAGAVFRGVHQTTPVSGFKVASDDVGDGDPENVTASITFTTADSGLSDLAAGQLFAAIVVFSSLSASATGFTELAGTELCDNPAAFFTGGMAVIYGVSTGNSITLSVQCNHSTGAGMTWRVLGGRLNPA